MVVKIYGTGTAVCSQRVMHCLVELGVEFELVEPFGQVPYIVDGDFELFESRAIVRYYGAKYVGKGPNLLGRTLEEKARVDQWLDAEAINYNPLVFPIVFNLFVLPRSGVPGNKAEAEAAVEKLDKVLEIYERQLSKTKYLAGNEFTLADLTHIPATRYLVENCNMDHLITGKKHVKAWWEDITSRPAWKKTMSFVESRVSHFYP
ncbi:glutathione S-transferase F12 isoform X2 [Ananas comosus]|uniref:glutathione transferase n=1 Tax=Ananas comosus TaxID=4615 RepID=A0A6P5FGX1_ANACO|nr:glutathione S-transferase F12 isoform X2 [Ananas comosus]